MGQGYIHTFEETFLLSVVTSETAASSMKVYILAGYLVPVNVFLGNSVVKLLK